MTKDDDEDENENGEGREEGLSEVLEERRMTADGGRQTVYQRRLMVRLRSALASPLIEHDLQDQVYSNIHML